MPAMPAGARQLKLNPKWPIWVAPARGSNYTEYNDSGTGTITLSGTGTDDLTFSYSVLPQARFRPNPRFPFIFKKLVDLSVAAPSVVYTDSGSGTITLSGTGTESSTNTDSGTGTITFSGTSTEDYQPPASVPVRSRGRPNPAWPFTPARVAGAVTAAAAVVYTDSGSGTITLSGSGTDSLVFTNSGTGTIVLSGTGLESFVHASSGSGTITLSGAGTITHVYSDFSSGTITLSGTGTETFERPGGHPPTSWWQLMAYPGRRRK